MGLILKRVNEALAINPPPNVRQRLSVNGSNWLWACVALYCVVFVCFYPAHLKCLPSD